jgi:hypothetical protein
MVSFNLRLKILIFIIVNFNKLSIKKCNSAMDEDLNLKVEPSDDILHFAK